MIAYSADAEPARAYLLRGQNDIDIFVEDATCQNMYVRLFNRILSAEDKKIAHVFPLHGRKNVLDECARVQALTGRRRLFLIDGDLDLILGTPTPALNHLYRLQVYCSENLLLSESAAINIATEYQIDSRWHDLAVQLSIRTLMERSVRILFPLFLVYAAATTLGVSIVTTDYPVQRLLEDKTDPFKLSATLVRRRMAEVISAICASSSRGQYRRTRSSIASRLSPDKALHSALISGKRYLLPLLHLQLTKVARMNESQERLKVRLAQYCELDIDPGLTRAVLDALT